MFRRRLYYLLKPYIPWAARISVRRHFALKKRAKVENIWPIDKSCATPPQNWSGWPKNEQFAFVLSHDVEGKKGLEKVKRLAEVEIKHGFRSSFNFIPKGEYSVPDDLLKWLRNNGFEIGVHDLRHDGKLYESEDKFSLNAKQINQFIREWEAVGFRSGFMHHNLDWIHELDILYDASTFDTDPFEPQPDGIGTIFPLMVSSHRGKKGYVELPYTLPQDSTLFLLFRERTSQIWLDKLDWLAEQGGMVLLNVHPDYIQFEDEAPNPDTFPIARYVELLEYVEKKHKSNYWAPLPKELAAWFKDISTRPDLKLEQSTLVSAQDQLATSETGPNPTHRSQLAGKRAGVLLLSKYPNDPRPRRAAEALAAQGMTVELICLKQKKKESSRDFFNGVNILRLPMQHKRGGKLAYLFHYLSFIAASFAIITFRSLKKRYDIVHVHNMPDILVFSCILPRLLGSKIVLDLHDPMPELMQTIYGLPESSKGVKLLKFLEKISIGFSDAVITVNQTCKKIFSKRSCPAEKILVVMNAVDEKVFSIRSPKSLTSSRNEKFSIMYHGSLVERNGLGLAVRAMARVRKPLRRKMELRIYGEDTDFLQAMLSLAAKQGIENSIRYMGSKSIEEIVAAIDDCDLGIIPNLRNIFTLLNTPTRIFEFLSRGKPVIAPSAPGIMEYFSEKTLVTFELGSEIDLASKIEYAYDNPKELLEITGRGHQVCLSHRWKEEQEGFLNLIENQLGCKDERKPDYSRLAIL